jgi:hypothetical protein
VNETARALKEEFPLLWAMSEQYDFAERLGGCTDALYAEADAVLRELWLARMNAWERNDAWDSLRPPVPVSGGETTAMSSAVNASHLPRLPEQEGR